MMRNTRIGLATLIFTALSTTAQAVTFETAAQAKNYTYGSTGSIGVHSFDSLNPFANNKTPGDVTDLAGVNNYTAASKIYAYSNQITSIDPGDFTGLGTLTLLNLSGNDIATIDTGSFTGLSSLEELYLYENHITSIDTGGFTGLSSLNGLVLDDNPITSLSPGAFSGLASLTYLKFDQSSLATIPAGVFSDVPTLNDLWLEGGLATDIASGAFSGLTLQWLHLAENQLSSLEAGDFSGLSVGRLELIGNQIETIGPSTFVGMSAVDDIVLSTYDGTNPLTSIGDNAFEGRTDLKKLVLADLATLSTLNLTGADFGDDFNIQLKDTTGLTDVDLTGASLTQAAFDGLMNPQGGDGGIREGIADLSGITSLSFESADLSAVTDFSAMYGMGDLVTLFMPGAIVGDLDQIDDLVAALASLDNLTISPNQWAGMNTATQNSLTAWDDLSGNTLTVAAVGVPEPSTLVLAALGLMSLGMVRRR